MGSEYSSTSLSNNDHRHERETLLERKPRKLDPYATAQGTHRVPNQIQLEPAGFNEPLATDTIQDSFEAEGFIETENSETLSKDTIQVKFSLDETTANGTIQDKLEAGRLQRDRRNQHDPGQVRGRGLLRKPRKGDHPGQVRD